MEHRREEKKGVILFGGAGFIGTHLARKLNSLGHLVFCVDNQQPKKPVDGVEYCIADVRDLGGIVLPGKFDTIYNLAAVHTTPGHAPHEYYETNVLGASEISAFARRFQIKNVFFTSSISVYGPGEETKTELSEPSPASAYGWSKLLAERIHRAWLADDPNHRLIICRPAVIFGHGEGGNFTRLAQLLKKGFFVYPGRKDTIKACFYVEDLIDSMIDVQAYASAENNSFVLYNGCYPDRYTLEQIVDAFRISYMTSARTIAAPRAAVLGAAKLIRPFSAVGIGIHPDRILKLVTSTDVLPTWLQAHGLSSTNLLSSALQRWHDASNGTFR